ncbi:serine/threonine protein kinase, partial [Actinomyces sp. S6-Spd3]
ATMTQTNAVVGTAQYLSPEQAHGDPVDARSDIYSTGCVLFELLTGQPPFKGDSAVAVAYQHVSEIPPKPSSITSDVPDSIDRVVLKALAKNRDDRYSSAEEMRADLNRAARGALVMAPETDSWQAPATQVMSPATMTMPAATMPPPAPAYDTQTMARIDTLEEEPKKKRWPIALLIVVALAMIGGLVWWFATNSAEPEVEQVPVPTVVGQTQEQAIARLKEAGLEFAIASTEASSEIPANSVISSDPEAGTIVDK